MRRNWDEIKWFFEADGSLRDIYIQDIILADWEKLIDFINSNYQLKFGENDSNQIDKEYIMKFLTDETSEMETTSLRIDFNRINIHCYFFLNNQIEFDIDPKEINSLNDFETIEKFMTSISKTLNSQITLTAQSYPEFPIFKIDFHKNINKFLTENEAKKLTKRRSRILVELSLIKMNFIHRFFPKKFNKELLNSANKPYVATEKEKNLW